MKFSTIAVAAVCYAASAADAFAGPQMKPRFAVQVRESSIDRGMRNGSSSDDDVVVFFGFRLPYRTILLLLSVKALPLAKSCWVIRATAASRRGSS